MRHRVPQHHNVELLRTDDDALRTRLHDLRWPDASDALRDRCWNAFSARLGEPAADDQPPARTASDRLEYRRRAAQLHVAPAQIASGRRPWAARPALALRARVA